MVNLKNVARMQQSEIRGFNATQFQMWSKKTCFFTPEKSSKEVANGLV